MSDTTPMASHESLSRLLLRWIISALGVAVAVVGSSVLLSGEVAGPAATSAAWGWLTAIAAAALIAVGAFSASRIATRNAGLLTGLLAVAFLAPIFAGWLSGPPILRAFAALVTPLVVPVLATTVFVAASVRARRMLRLPVSFVWGLSGALTLVRVVVRDPLREAQCWADCTVRSLAVIPVPALSRGTGIALGIVAVLGAAGATAAIAVRRHRERLGIPHALLPWLWSSLTMMAAYAVLFSLYELAPIGERRFLAAVHLVAVCAAIAIAASLLRATIQADDRVKKVKKIVIGLDRDGADSLEEEFRVTLDDSTATLRYWLPDPGAFVTADGLSGALDAGDDRRRVDVRRRGELVAVIHVDSTVPIGLDLADRLGPTALLALDNERLTAGLNSQLSSLTASRRSVVAATDATRQRVERDLHDAAQAELVGLLYFIAQRRAEADQMGDRELIKQLADVSRELATIAAQLRELAHGVYPSILDTAGLSAALETLADLADSPITITYHSTTTAPTVVQHVAYLTVAAAAEDAAARGDALNVTVSVDDGALHLSLAGVLHQPTEDILDRIGALGGTYTHIGNESAVILPCE